jgi:hypothetical protein
MQLRHIRPRSIEWFDALEMVEQGTGSLGTATAVTGGAAMLASGAEDGVKPPDAVLPALRAGPRIGLRAVPVRPQRHAG